MFRLAPEFNITKTVLPDNHREYEVTCTLKHIITGQIWGQGVGSCSTMEGKYRFRTGEVELTGKPVPKDYWNERNQELLGGKGFSAKKNPDTGQWEIAKQGMKVEHDNPADYYNTVLKMAKKRAHVDAMLTATAASDIFTQDIEEIQENMKVYEDLDKTNEVNTVKDKEPDSNRKITEKQRKRLFAIATEHSISEDELKTILLDYGFESSKDLTNDIYEKIIIEISQNGNGSDNTHHIKGKDLDNMLELLDKHTLAAFNGRYNEAEKTLTDYDGNLCILTTDQNKRIQDRIAKIKGDLF